MDNTNFQTIHQMGNAINNVVRQAMGRDNVQNIDMDYVTVAQRKRAVEETATGNPATFNTNAIAPMEVLIPFAPVQSGIGDPSPENIRPISGWTEAKITRTGKNLFDSVRLLYKTGKGINGSGEETTNTNYNTYKEVLPIGTYTFSVTESNTSANKTLRVYTYDSNDSPLQGFAVMYTDDGRKSVEFTVDAQTAYVLFSARTSTSDMQVEIGSIATDYSVSSMNEYTITFPSDAGTVYGGTLTVNNDGTGTLVVDKGYTTVNDKTWEYDATYTRFRTAVSGIKRGSTRKIPFICSAFVSIDDGRAISDVPDNSIYAAGTSDAIYIKNTTYTDATLFKTTFADVQIVYPLETPVTYQLTNQQVIETLMGLNNVWSNTTGDITVMYKNYEEVI